MWVEQDFLQRQIRQVAQALARLLGLKANEADDEKLVAALDELDRAYDDILGTPRALLARADAASVRMILGSDGKLDAYRWLLDKEAELRDARGEHAVATALRARSAMLVS